jgi:hypothetical protein
MEHRSDWRFNVARVRGAEPIAEDGEMFVDLPFSTTLGDTRVVRIPKADAEWMAVYLSAMVRQMNGENA